MARSKVPAVLLLAFLAAALGLARAHEGHDSAVNKNGKVEPGGIVRLTSASRTSVGLMTVPVEERTFDEVLVASGKIVAPWSNRSFATARVAGRVLEISVKPWDRVTKGQVLATIESPELEDLGLALTQARLRHHFYAEARKREESLVGKGISAAKVLVEIETELSKAASAEETARNKLLALGVDLAAIQSIAATGLPVRTLSVRAPLGGVVVHVDVTQGELVEPTKHLFEVHDVSTVWAEAKVLEPDVRRVSVGQEAIVRAAGLIVRGQIVEVSLDADPQDRALRVYVALPNGSGLLKENLPVRVELVAGRSVEVAAVPRSAIVSLGVERFVLAEEEPGVYKRRDLVEGRSDSQWVEALEGLYLGDRVVVAGQHELGGFFAQGELRLSASARRRLNVVEDEVELGGIADVAHAVGHVRLPIGAEATTVARVAGKVSALTGRAGQRVHAGDLLATVESLDVENMQLDLIQADIELALARKDLERVRSLAAQEIEPRAELFRVETEFQRQTALVGTLTRKLRLVGLSDEEIVQVRASRKALAALPVRASIDGALSAPLAVLGQVVALGTPIFHIEETSTVWIEGAASPADVAKIASGLPVRVRLPALPGEVFAGKVAFIGAVLDETARSLPVYVALTNPDGRLRVGLQATVDVEIGRTQDVIAAPLASVLSESGQPVVIVSENGTYRRVPVRLGDRRDDQRIEIAIGLFPGDRVVTTGAEEVRSALLSVR